MRVWGYGRSGDEGGGWGYIITVPVTYDNADDQYYKDTHECVPVTEIYFS